MEFHQTWPENTERTTEKLSTAIFTKLTLPDDCLPETHITSLLKTRSKILVAVIGHGRRGGQAARGDGMAFTVEFCLTLRRLMSYIYIYIYMEHPFLMFLDHTQRRSTVGRTPLDE